jgi:hypothetical protein
MSLYYCIALKPWSNFGKRTWVTEVLCVLGDGIAIKTGMAGIIHKIYQFLLLSLFSEFTEMQPMTCRIFALGFYGI